MSDKKYVATTGLNYPSAIDGKERRVEIGEPCDDMPALALKNEIEAGHAVLASKFNPEPDDSGEEGD